MLSLNRYLKVSKLIVCLLLFKISISQNLIFNGSFENYTNIDCANGGFDRGSFPFTHVLDNWYGYQSPDYFNSVCNPGGFNVPNSYFGHSYSENGNAFVGMVVYAKGVYDKEYMYQQLSQPLQAGHVYCLSFYVSMADRFTYAIKNIGALFSTNLMPLTNGYEINAVPQVLNQNGYLADTTQWVEIQGCFTAVGGEKYLTLGNFTSNFSTDTLNTNSTNLVPGRENVSYYYIDHVTLVEDLSTAINESEIENNFKIYPNPSNGIIEINTLSEEKFTLQISNAIGQLIQTTSLPKGKTRLDLSHEQEGIYFYHILLNDKIIKTDKIVILR